MAHGQSFGKMKRLLVSAALFLSALAAPSADFILKEWDEYKAVHHKSYETPEEDNLRLENYLANKRRVEEHNDRYQRGETKYTMGINGFSDWFPEELSQLNGLRVSESSRRGRIFQRQPGTVVPNAINWVEKGAVTPVKDQALCGSCYAFSAVGALEGLMFITNKTITSLSAQELVDCSANAKCNGGEMTLCFEYVKDHGIESEESYPYKADNGTCRFNKDLTVASCTGYEIIKEGDEDALREVVGTKGPVSIGFEVDFDFIFYDSGIFDGSCSDEMNHGMLAVGYGTVNEKGLDYWLVKNSWGIDWGENGYARVERNKNMCGIASAACYPTYN